MTDLEAPKPELPEPALLSVGGIAGRGLFMGLAEVVPGVSGGTIALITGIYPRLVAALASFGPRSVSLLIQPRQFFAHHDLGFLLTLALGMGVGILLFARVMAYLLANYQPLVWAFFCGVILMSVVVIALQREREKLLLWLPGGLLCGLALMWLPVADQHGGGLLLFFGGAIAVCAWLLPAVSGSFMLLALGLYETVIAGIAELDFAVIFSVGAGCVVGLLLFAKLLAWVLARYTEQVLSFLTGFMLGSVVKLWPWQDVSISHGWARLVSPARFSELAGEPCLIAAIVCGAFGACGLWLLSRYTYD
jgi:putative membrane protein